MTPEYCHFSWHNFPAFTTWFPPSHTIISNRNIMRLLWTTTAADGSLLYFCPYCQHFHSIMSDFVWLSIQLQHLFTAQYYGAIIWKYDLLSRSWLFAVKGYYLSKLRPDATGWDNWDFASFPKDWVLPCFWKPQHTAHTAARIMEYVRVTLYFSISLKVTFRSA